MSWELFGGRRRRGAEGGSGSIRSCSIACLRRYTGEMHRYHPPLGGGSNGVGNSSPANPSSVSRDSVVRPDVGFSASSSLPLTTRRLVPLTPYTLKCEQEALSARLGPPDYFPPTPNCAEESLGRDACQNGYKEIVDGIEESRETGYSLVNLQWAKPLINKYKEAIWKRLNALNNSLVRKRKAGQVYGVPLSGTLLLKPGHFPEQRHSGEDNRKKWIEDLAQHKRLRVLADHVPHGLRRRSLFEALIKTEVPFLRATWCIKVMYLNQVRPLSTAMSGGSGDKSQTKRVELLTKDVLEYMLSLLDELGQHGENEISSGERAYISATEASQQLNNFSQGTIDGDIPPLHKRWHYMTQLLQLHLLEGLLNRAIVVDWVLKQLQERDRLDATEFLLPIVLDLIDDIATCQTLVRTLVEIFLHRLQMLCPASVLPDASEQPAEHYIATFLAELLCYLITVVPDSFLALECFPLPAYIFQTRKGLGMELKDGKVGQSSAVSAERAPYRLKRPRTACEAGVKFMVDVIQKRAMALAKTVNPGSLRKNEGSVVQCLDKVLSTGDIFSAYRNIFDDDFCGHEQPPDEWISKVSSWVNLSSSGSPSPAEVFPVRFLCEWAICDFRDHRKRLHSPLVDHYIANVQASCKVYIAVSVLRLRTEELEQQGRGINTGNGGFKKSKMKISGYCKAVSSSSFFDSPGPIHDIIAAWLDQHDLRKVEGFERLQLLLWELVKQGLFWPPAYVRKLLVSGVLEKNETPADVERASRHICFLQHLPWPPGLSQEEEGRKALDPALGEAIRIHRNERRFCLNGFGQHQSGLLRKEADINKKLSQEPTKNVEETKCMEKSPFAQGKMQKLQKKKVKVMDLKQAIAKFFHFPESCVGNEVRSLQDKSASFQRSLKRQSVPYSNSGEKVDGTPGCDECRRKKKQKVNDGSCVFTQGHGVGPGDEVDMWWTKKAPKPLDAAKPEPVSIIKPPKQPSRGRPKAVRKLSLAQLDAARIEGSQGASSSHACDSKVNCPYHKPPVEDAVLSQNKQRKKTPLMTDLKSIIAMLKCLRLCDRRIIATWLDATVRNLIGGSEKLSSTSISSQQPERFTVNVGHAADERSTIKSQFEDEELSAILCLLDVANDFCALIRLLLWLLPKASIPNVAPGPNSNFSAVASSLSKESVCTFSESVILTSLKRYEGILLATNLLPEAFSAGMKRAALMLLPGSNSRASCSSLFTYIHDLYKKYGNLQSVQLWEKDWKACSDQRLVSEVELLLKAGDNDPSFPARGVDSPNIGDDRDESFPPRLVGRLVRFGPHMRDHVRRGFQEVINQMIAKEREVPVPGMLKDTGIERWGEGLQAAHSVASGLLECIKQQASSAVNGDIQLAAAAVSSVVGNVGSAVAGVFENLASSSSYFSSVSMAACVKCARRVLHAHMQCLRHLKEAFCEKQSKVLECALACEATTIISNSNVHSYSKAPRPQFQHSPEMPDPGMTLNDQGAGTNGSVLGRSNTAAAAVAAFVVCAVLEDVASLERMISLLKIKEGLENVKVSKVNSLSANGISRVMSSANSMKSDSMPEIYLFWFRVLISDCRSLSGGLLPEILGESNILALLRLQRHLPLTTIFSPAYSLFSISLRAQQSALMSISNREDVSFQQLAYAALGDLFAHPPFCEVCLQDTKAFADLLHSDSGDAEYASFLDNKGADAHKKVSLLVPSRSRLFLHAILDHKIPTLSTDESYTRSLKGHSTLAKELVQVLDDIHPATFHWQWVELRLLLNEQIFMDKFEAQNLSVAAEAMQAARLAILDKQNLSETEKNLTDMILTRLLVRPDAAALYSEVLHMLGRAFEDYLILQVQWILENGDMVLGRKFLRQQLEEVAQRQKFEVGSGKLRVWEWVVPQPEESAREKNSKTEVASPEEGEVAEDDLNTSKQPRSSGVSGSYRCIMVLKKQFAIEKALADLVLPCLARSSAETYNRFASRLVKQISELEQQVTALSRCFGRPVVAASEAGINKRLGSRKGARTGLDASSPNLGRRASLVTDPLPPSLAALQTSLWLRLQFLLPLLPPIYTDREQLTVRNMRSILAPVLLRLAGTRVVQESVESFCFTQHDTVLASGCDAEWNAETSAAAAAALMAGENLFDRILSILHALLSSTWASWLKQKPSKGSSRPPREVPPFDKETVHRMQVDLDHMQLPLNVRARLQAAMPILAPSSIPTIAAGPPQVPPGALPMIQMSGVATNSSPGPLSSSAISYKAPNRIENNLGKAKQNPVQDLDVEIDPWMLLEDITSSSTTGAGVLVMNESGTSKACSWLKGAVRVRRTNLTYVSSIDDDS